MAVSAMHAVEEHGRDAHATIGTGTGQHISGAGQGEEEENGGEINVLIPFIPIPFSNCLPSRQRF